ncbi:hypothetical protein BFP72_00210 [Reichenbachiella sp. 5M10]|uniref:tetratricopeptide repeat protein n=1 Tax=Reichenbachiella sp. 5M10 TaxID=1889772 RepID=UPI000C15EAB6|nr:tetratricopeptide repeat protein [Reichenbachiella sp. 5M10]PIB33966.1 hypothetical protein BFP72_00210 [Reichenbachiella sp. 5M10]
MTRLIKTGFIGLLVFIAPLSVWCNSGKIDSLKTLLKSTLSDQQRVNIMLSISKEFHRNDSDSALYYVEKSLALSEKTNYQAGLAKSLRRLGLIYSLKANYAAALPASQRSLLLFQALGDTTNTINSLNNLGGLYRKLGQYAEAFEYYQEAENIAKAIKSDGLTAITYNNLGILYKTVGEYDSAIVYYFKSIELKQKRNMSVSSNYTNIGLIKLDLGDYNDAEEYFSKALELEALSNDHWGVANCLENIGSVKLQTGQYDEAYDYFEQALDGFVKLQAKSSIAINYDYLGQVLLKQRRYTLANEYLEKSKDLYHEINDKLGLSQINNTLAQSNLHIRQFDLSTAQALESLHLAQDIGALKEASEAAKTLYEIYGQLEDGKNTYKFSKLHIQLKDSLFDNQKLEYITRLESKQQLSLIERENLLLMKENQLREKKLEASHLRIQRQNIIQMALIVCLICAIVTALIWYLFNHKKRKTIRILEELNNEILLQKEKIANQAIELHQVNGEMRSMNESLEFLVKERTKKIESQNEKLRDYAFANSHEVRAPLSNLLGLINISKFENLSSEEQELIIEKIHSSALDLDHVITKVNKILEEEKL